MGRGQGGCPPELAGGRWPSRLRGGRCKGRVVFAMICIPAAVVQVNKESPELCQVYPLCEGIPIPVPEGVSGVPRRWKYGLLRVGMEAGVLETSPYDMTCCVSVGELVGRSLYSRVGGDT